MRLDQQPIKSVPKPISKKPNKRKKRKQKHVELFKGVKIPHRKQRARIKRKEYNKALEEWGEGCSICGSYQIEMHHVVYRSQQGRGGHRNLRPLCKAHHSQAHTDRQFADKLRAEHEERYGEWYWADRFDLWKAGKIHNPTEELFNKFMEGEEGK